MSAAVNLSSYDDGFIESDAQRASSASVFNVGGWSNSQVAAVKKLLRFGRLAPNWDSYGSRTISIEVIRTAIDLLSHASLEDLPSPSILPVSGGGIQLEWVKGDRELQLEVKPDCSIVYLIAENDEPLEEERLLEPAEVERLLSWLMLG